MADQRIGTDFAGFRILELIGRGGMGVVYLAEHRVLGRRAAIKLLAPELSDDTLFRERFLAESRAAARIDHPNIVPVYEAGESDGTLFLAMRYVEGRDLRSMLADGPIEAQRVVGLLGPVASALDAAHAVGLVHRDVKPGNILVDGRDGHPFLSDFGLTKHVASHTGLTRTGQFIGTPDYVAPEQITGAPITGAADQYALACVAFECLTGRVPFERETELAAMYAHVDASPPDIASLAPNLPGAVSAVFQRALAKRPEDRFPTCSAFVEAMAAAIGEGSTRLTPATDAPFGRSEVAASTDAPTIVDRTPTAGEDRRPPWARRVPPVALGAASVLALLVGFVVFGGFGDPDGSPAPTDPTTAVSGSPDGSSVEPTASEIGSPGDSVSASLGPSPSPSPSPTPSWGAFASTAPSTTPPGTPRPSAKPPSPTPPPTPTPAPTPTPTPAPTPTPTLAFDPSRISSPANGSQIGSSAIFVETVAAGAYTYSIYVGSAPPPTTCSSPSGCTGTESTSVTGVSKEYSTGTGKCGGGENCYGNPYPINASLSGWPAGSVVYVRLITKFTGPTGPVYWRDYSYTTAP